MDMFENRKKDEKSSLDMQYDEKLGSYVIEIKNIVFVSDDKCDDDYISNLNKVADNYYKSLNDIIEFMLPDLKAMYGEIDKEKISEKLGKPIIDYDNGIVKYLEQSFDKMHIFSFEFLGDDFKKLAYFSIDG